MLEHSKDTFWDIRQRERQEDEVLDARVKQVQRAMDVVRRVSAVKNAAGFQELLEAMRSLRKGSLHKLENDKSLTDAGLREQRGYTRGLSDVIGLMEKDQALDDLAQQLKEAQTAQAEALRRRPPTKREERK